MKKEPQFDYNLPEEGYELFEIIPFSSDYDSKLSRYNHLIDVREQTLEAKLARTFGVSIEYLRKLVGSISMMPD